MKEFKYKTSFSSKIAFLSGDEKEKCLSIASLDNLKSIIPNEYKDQIDLLAIAFNSCTPNLANKNGDMIDNKIALDIYKKFIGRPINLNHKRYNGSIGHIVSAGFSNFDPNYINGKATDIIQANDIVDNLLPFNLCLGGVLYRLYEPELIELIEESGDPKSDKYLSISASWELMYDSFDLAIGSKYLKDCEIISDESKISELLCYLPAYGGNGKLPNGKQISRLLKGEVFAAGIGLTEDPAGEVSGIYVDNNQIINMKNEEKANNNINQSESKEIIEISDKTIESVSAELAQNVEKLNNTINLFIKNNENIEKNISQLDNTDVNADRNLQKNMKLNSISEITDENLKQITTASQLQEIFAFSMKEKIDSELKKISDDYSQKLVEKDNAIKANQNNIADVTAKYEEVNKNLEKLIKASEEKEKLETFSARMSSLEESFDLTDEQKNSLAEDIKLLADEESFAAFMKKQGIFLKKKGDKKKDEKVKEEVKASVAEVVNTEKVVNDALATGEKKEEVVANTAEVKEESLADQAKKAFGLENWVSTKKR